VATGRIGVTPALRTRWSDQPTVGTTSLSGLDDNSVSLVYDVGYEAVYRNGVLLSRGNDYTATDGTTVTLIDATLAGDIIEIFANELVPLTDAISKGQYNAKGALLSATAASTPGVLAVGANDTVLTADSAEATGLKWGGGWTTFTPTRGNITVGNGTEVARYQKMGKTTNVFYQLTLGSTSSIGSTPSIAAPTTPAQSVFYAGICMFQDTGSGTYMGSALIIGSTVYPQALGSAGTYVNAANPSATIPFTWTNTDVLTMQFSYEEA
jgi:hypothetical protein